jgi:hypothetical protein
LALSRAGAKSGGVLHEIVVVGGCVISASASRIDHSRLDGASKHLFDEPGPKTDNGRRFGAKVGLHREGLLNLPSPALQRRSGDTQRARGVSGQPGDGLVPFNGHPHSLSSDPLTVRAGPPPLVRVLDSRPATRLDVPPQFGRLILNVLLRRSDAQVP